MMWLSLSVQVKFVQVNDVDIYQLISPKIIAIFFCIAKDAAKKIRDVLSLEPEKFTHCFTLCILMVSSLQFDTINLG